MAKTKTKLHRIHLDEKRMPFCGPAA